MKKLLAAVTLFVLCAASAHGQSPTFRQSLDFPLSGAVLTQSQIASTGGKIAAGWAFDCATGEHPVFAVPVLVNLDTNTVWHYDYFFQKDHLYRPDVFAAFGSGRSASCKVHEYEGYQLYVSPVPPPGRYRVWVLWDKNTIFADFTITTN